MSIIGDAKAALARAIEQELGEIRADADALVARIMEASEDASGLNGLSDDLRRSSTAIRLEAEKIGKAAETSVTKLSVAREPIEQWVDEDLVRRITTEKVS